jgi:hypothetical protein
MYDFLRMKIDETQRDLMELSFTNQTFTGTIRVAREEKKKSYYP